jgi:hypothetical protein
MKKKWQNEIANKSFENIVDSKYFGTTLTNNSPFMKKLIAV